MESGERQESPSPSPAPSSLHVASSSTSSSPAPPQTLTAKFSPVHSPDMSSHLAACGNLPQMTRDERVNLSGTSNGFGLAGHPAFGLYTSGSGRSEFGGLGSLGLSAMAAHSQFAAFPDWWRPSEAHTRGAAAFFPPLLGLHPAFVSSLKRHNAADLQSHASGVNGAVNGRSASNSAANAVMSASLFPAKVNKEQTQADGSRSQKSSREPGHLRLKTNQRTKEKKPHKRQAETSSMSGSQSGSLTESSTDGGESSSDNMEEEEEDDDEEEEESSDSEDSDSEKESAVKGKAKRLTQNQSKKKRPCAADRNAAPDRRRDGVPSTYHVQTCSRPAGLPPSTSLFLQSPRISKEENKPHISVIQTTGLAVSSSHAQPHRDACPLPSRSSPNPVSFSTSSKHVSSSDSTKHVPSLSSPKHSSFSPSSQPLALCSPKKSVPSSSSPKPSALGSINPFSLPALPKPPAQLPSKKPSSQTFLMPCSRLVQPVEESRGSLLDGVFKSKQPLHPKDSVKQTFPPRPKNQSCGDSNLFLTLHSNGAISGAVQDAPLALITKPQRQSGTPNSKPLLAASSPPYPTPMNLSIGGRHLSGAPSFPHKSSASSGPAPRSRKMKTPKTVNMRKTPVKSNSLLARGSESDVHSSKDSDDSLGDDNDDDDDDEDDIEDEDSGSSISELESNLESDSDGSEDNVKECMEAEADSDADRTPPKGAEVTSAPKSSSSSELSANCSLLNLQIPKTPSLHSGLETPTTSTTTWSKHTPSYSFAPVPGSGKRRRVTDERVLRLPLDFGWRRETRIRTVAGRLQGEVAYFAPCGKKLRQYPDVMKYLVRNGITEISRDNFSFSTKIKVGDFYEAREGSEGMRWFLLPEDEIVPIIIAMDGRRSRRSKFEPQPPGDGRGIRQWKSHPLNVGEKSFQDVSDAKLLRKLEAQEIARQAAQIKMMRKLEKQAMAQAAKEARKRQALIAAEERRKKREQIKILKQQEKIKRIQQIRMEKELRAQQILEAKRKKKEAAANARILEAEKRNKEKEIRRLQAVILKHQELERHRLDMERERRRQHMILMKAVEARKKAEEKERLKKEKKDEKRLNKERKLELRRLELEKAKELKKPNEDLCLADHKPLPELSRIPGLVLSGRTFSDCLMVLQFLHSFGKVLGLGFESSDVLTASDLQEGLLNAGPGMSLVQDLLVNMLSAALRDPGMPAGHKSKTILGDHLTNVELNRDNVSEILQLYMEAHSEQTEAAVSLRTKAFQAHSPSQKASMLAFLVNELCCSKAVISEIDKSIDYMTNLRKDKWAVEGKLRKLRSVHAKRTGKKDGGAGAEDNTAFTLPTIRNKRKRKDGDSEEEEDEEDDSDDQGDEDEDEEEEPGGKKGKKVDICDEEDDSVHSASIEELEKQIEKVYKQQSQIRQKMLDSSHSLRSAMIGQDRYKRRYWVLPRCSGIFVEGSESAEDCEEMEEGKQQKAAEGIKVKEERLEETNEPGVSSTSTNSDKPVPDFQKDKDNLFLQKPGSLSKLSKLLEVAKMAQDSAINSQNSRSAEVFTGAPYPLYPTSQTATTQQGPIDKTDALAPSLLADSQLKSSQWMNRSPQSVLHYDQLSKILTEKNNQWFSLLPRSPCDESSVTSGSSPPASSPPQPVRTNSPAVLSSNPAAGADCKTGIDNMLSPIHQQVKSSIHQSRLPLCDVFGPATTPSLPFSGTPQSPVLDRASQHAEGDGNKANGDTVNGSRTPAPPADNLTCAPFPAVDVVKTQDYCTPQPIPEEMLRGWWTVSDMEKLQSLVKALHSRGIREKVLQKQIQKHMEDMTLPCADSKSAIDLTELEKQKLSRKAVEDWCVEEHAMKVDVALLQQVEALERKVIAAGLQVKGWKRPEPQSDREDLVYHEHKPFPSPPLPNKGQRDSGQEEFPGSVVRRLDSPLDIAVTRLAELERHIERSSEEEAVPGMRLWRKAVGQVHSSAQLSLCIQQLQKSIVWERAIMKVHCQLCQRGDNEDLLLLCDGCDKGCHTYCHKPKIITVPEGDWFCPTCVLKESGQSPPSRKQQSRTAGGGKRGSDVKRNGKPSVVGELISEEDASSVPKKGTKEFKKRRRDDSPPLSQAKYDGPVSCAKKAKPHKDDKKDLATCRVLLAELETHQDAWPFLKPVDLKAVPGYRKVIKKPMDFSTIREKLNNSQYSSLETFIIDVNLVFDNCERFNEDDSEIGRAGHNMRRFFDKRWTELLQ